MRGSALSSFLIFLFIVGTIGVGASVVAPQHSLGLLGKTLLVNEPPLPADGIVILLGANGPDRVYRAYQLYRNGYAKKLVFGSGYENTLLRDGIEEEILWPKPSTGYILALKSLGVPEEDIIVLPSTNAYDTAHELEVIAEYARAQGWSTVGIVTSAAHTLRTRLIWRRIAPDIFNYIVSAPAPGFSEWWNHGRYRQEVGYEYVALVKEFWSSLTSIVPER